jgi:hypothetical protein
MRSRKRPGQPLLGNFRSPLIRLRAHPLRTIMVGAMSLMLVWIVLVKSLPFVLAPGAPSLALALNPSNPVALIARSRQIRERLLAQGNLSPEASGGENGGTQTVNTMAESLRERRDEREAMRTEIRGLATRAIAKDPLNSEAYRLLAELETDPNRTRLLMQEAAKRSRRESIAVFWLLNDSFYHQDYQTSLVHAAILLKTRPELADYVLAYVSRIAEAPAGRPFVVQALVKTPSWRKQFFDFLPRRVVSDVPYQLMASLKEMGSPPSGQELAPYLDALISKNRVDAAYNTWLQFLPEDYLANLELLTNGSFQNSPSGLPFDWRIAPGQNAIAELVPSGGTSSEHVLHVSFGSGRVKFPELSQVLYLAPGRYRLEGKLRGRIVAKRGLRWQISCATGARRSLAETDMFTGETQHWRVFTLDAKVPAAADCVGQVLRLFHDSRSASEELISGEAWFGGLHLEHARDGKAASQ